MFVSTAGTQFVIDGARFPIVGVNCYFLSFCTEASRAAVLEEARAMGGNVIRTSAFHDDLTRRDGEVCFQYSDNGVITVNDGADGLQRLDACIADAETHGIKLILPLVNHWGDFGGMPRYLEWLGLPPNTVEFYRAPLARSAYRNWIRTLLTRRNTRTGRLYLDEPAVMAWELANEPRCPGDHQLLLDWVGEMSEYIQSLDTNHLVACGDEGFFRRGFTFDDLYDGSHGVDCEAILRLGSVDFGTYHMYPDHWGRPNDFGQRWIADHCAAGRRAVKPVLLEEYGVKDAAARNAVIALWLAAVEDERGAGDLLWMLGGEGADVRGFRDGYTVLRAADVPAVAEHGARLQAGRH
ncbi:MAG: cellulase family glycosylhydrolase [Acidobacteria bacterium]|nr:cellulase family glycosylhydrolase [Acidobacteriota bacterium]